MHELAQNFYAQRKFDRQYPLLRDKRRWGRRDKIRLLTADIELPQRADGGSYRSRPTRIFVI